MVRTPEVRPFRAVVRASDLSRAAVPRPRTIDQRLAARLQLLASASVAYAILAILSGIGPPFEDGIAEIWLPAGLSDALALKVGFWALPVPLLGTLIDHLAHGGQGFSGALIVALGRSAGAATVALLAPRLMQGRDLFASLRNLFGCLAAVVVGSTTSTLIASLALPELRDWSQQGAALSWWAGNLTGSLVIAPPLLSWLGRGSSSRLREFRRTEFVLLVLAVGLSALVISRGWISVLSLRPATAVLPLSLWACFRFSPAAATPVNATLAVLLSRLPNPGDQRLQLLNSSQTRELLELSVMVTLVTGLAVLVVNSNRLRTTRQLRQLTGSLERTVDERTSALAAANAQLQILSETDGLTGLVNRRRFDALLRERWRQCALTGTSLAVAMIDIDHFKAYNDHYGHPAGDLCLQKVAGALAAQVRNADDCVARYGGEEFVVLWSGLPLAQAAAMAERLRQTVAGLTLPHAASPVAPQVSLSIGVAARQLGRAQAAAPADEREQQIDALLRLADQRLYAAKTAGRNRVMAA